MPVKNMRVPLEAIRTLMQVEPAFLQKAYDTMTLHYGGAAQFFAHALNFGNDKQQQLRELLCEPA